MWEGSAGCKRNVRVSLGCGVGEIDHARFVRRGVSVYPGVEVGRLRLFGGRDRWFESVGVG